MLTQDNFRSGFLLDHEWMAGVTHADANTEIEPEHLAYVLELSSGTWIHCQAFSKISDALAFLNQFDRDWTYQSLSGCGGDCGKGECDPTQCPNANSQTCPL